MTRTGNKAIGKGIFFLMKEEACWAHKVLTANRMVVGKRERGGHWSRRFWWKGTVLVIR